MLPVKVALPFSMTGNIAGPRTTAIKGSQSARLEVETERRTAEVADSVPEACTWLVGVVRVNCGRSRVSVGGVVDAVGVGAESEVTAGRGAREE